MGRYTSAFAGALVILQATLLFLKRPATQWSFSTVQRSVSAYDWPSISAAFSGPRDPGNFSQAVMPYTRASNHSPFVHCLQEKWQQTVSPDSCRRLTHTSQRVDAVSDAWNPHLILLALCCVHLILCLSRVSATKEGGKCRLDPVLSIPTSCVIVGLAVITLIAGILSAIDTPGQLAYPTIILVVILFLCISRYAVMYKSHQEDLLWTLTCHLQFVGVPLTVITLATMGVRFWIDILTHSVLLSVAVNCLWLQQTLVSTGARQVAKLATVSVPTFLLIVTQQEWGIDSWQHVVAIMASVSLAPLYILTVLGQDGGGAVRQKSQLRVAHLCTTGALVATIANLAML